MIDLTSCSADPIFRAAERAKILLAVALPHDDRLLPPLDTIGWLLLVGDNDPIYGSDGPTVFAPQLPDWVRKAKGIALITDEEFAPTCSDAVVRAGKNRHGMIVIQTSVARRAEWLAFLLLAAPNLSFSGSDLRASTLWLTADPPDPRNRHERRAAGRNEQRRTA